MSADNAESGEPSDPLADYVCLGNFDPLVARRIIRRFARARGPLRSARTDRWGV